MSLLCPQLFVFSYFPYRHCQFNCYWRVHQMCVTREVWRRRGHQQKKKGKKSKAKEERGEEASREKLGLLTFDSFSRQDRHQCQTHPNTDLTPTHSRATQNLRDVIFCIAE